MDENLKLFLSSHIVKGDISMMIYNGDLTYLSKTLDGATAEVWYGKIEKEIKFETIGMQLFGESLSLVVPHFPVSDEEFDDIVDITGQYKNIISEYLKSGLFSDRRGSALFKILDAFGVGIYKGNVCYYRLKNTALDIIQSIKTSSTIEVGGQMIDISVGDISDIQRYENIMLLFKEVSDGYYDVRKHSIVDKQGGAYVQQEYCMGKDIYVEIDNDTKEVINVVQEDTKYNGYRSGEGRIIVTPDIIGYTDGVNDDGTKYKEPIYKEINTKDFLPYKTTTDGNILKIWMYGAYTHILRDLLEFKPLTRQYKSLMNFARLNFLAGCRRSGKCSWELELVMLSDGTMKYAKDLCVGDVLLSSDKKTPTIIKGINKYIKPVFKVTLGDGSTVHVTGDHRLPTQLNFKDGKWDNNILNYKQVMDLTDKDFVPKMFLTNVGRGGTYNEGALLGYFLGDGGVTTCTARITCFNDIQTDRIISIGQSVVGGNIYKNSRNDIIFNIGDSGSIKEFRKEYNLYGKANNKEIPLSVYGKSNDFKYGLLEGLIATDGYLGIKGKNKLSDGYNRKKSVYIEYCSVSEELIRGVQRICDMLGIISYIRNKTKKTYISGKEYVVSVWYLFISDNESINKIFTNTNLKGKKNYEKTIKINREQIGFSNNNISVVPQIAFNECNIEGEKFNDGINHYRKFNGLRGPRYDFQRRKCINYGIEHWLEYNRQRVVSIEFIGDDNVVDIEVDSDDHLYRLGTILSHNTFMSAYLILRELWKMPNSIRHISRQVRGLYIAPTEDKFKEVVDYIKKSSEKIRILKVVDFIKKENRLCLYDEVVSRNQKTQVTVATCDFSSAKGYEPGRGRASDLVIVDEAAFVDENVWLNILPILENEKAKLFAISTIDWTTQRNWFYEQLVEAEKGIDKDMFGMRVTIDDIDDVLVDDGMRKRMKAALKHDQPRYYAELYASLPEIGNVFNTEGFFTLNRESVSGEMVGGYIIGYDPAKRTDIGAVIVGEIRSGGGTGSGYCQLIEEYELKGEYQEQKHVLSAIKEKYRLMSRGGMVSVVIDATQVGDVVAEMFGDIIDYKVWYTAKGNRPSVDDYGAWKIAKNHLVHLSQILIERGIIKSYIGLRFLMDELKNFKTFKTPSGGTKYEAEVGHDDHVNAMMLIGFFLGYIEGRVYEFGMDGMNVTPEGIDPDTNLYLGGAKRYTPLENVFKGIGMGFGM